MITSARNSRLARLTELVSSGRERDSAGLIIVEGPRLLAEALDARLVLREIYAERGLPESLVAQVGASSTAEVIDVAPGLLNRIGDVTTSQGILAVLEAPRLVELSDLAAGVSIIAISIADPGNLGTLLRSAEAAGLVGVAVVGSGAHWSSPKVLRASAGAMFRVPIALNPSPLHAIAELREAGAICLATAATGGTSYTEVDLCRGTALLLGNEAHGLALELIEAADGLLHIPMGGRSESLNVAMAATVLAFEAARQRAASHSRLDTAPAAGQSLQL